MVKRKMFKGYWLVIFTVLLMINGCGGGGSSSDGASDGGGTVGVAVDPYITGAVFEEVTSGGEILQTSTASNSNGRFIFAHTVQSDSIVRMKSSMKGSHVGKPYEGNLLGAIDPEGDLVVSPLTTLLGNGFTAEQVITMLHNAGISGLQESDLYKDPMDGIPGLVSFTDDELTLLQASIAVNTYLLRLNDFSWGPEDPEEVALLAEAVEMVKYCLSLSRYQAVQDQLSSTLNGFGGSLTLDHLINATSNLLGTVTVAARNGEIIDPVVETQFLVDGLSELALHYYVQENRGDAAIEEAVSYEILPDIGTSQYPQVDLAGAVTVLNKDGSEALPEADSTSADDSQPGSLEFSAANYSADEASGNIDVLVKRVGGTYGAASVEVRTLGVTADYATDYESFSWTVVNFSDGQNQKTISIAITDDSVVEANETFTVLLRNPTGGTSLGALTEATVTIVDNDTDGGATPEPAPEIDVTTDANLNYLPVFPGARGFGTDTIAGRGGQIIRVTNLNDSGSGSLREALQASGPRIIVFEVSGYINLNSKITISNPYVTVAGQTAPSPGVCLRNWGITIKTHDVLMQHLAVRPGNPSEESDGIQILGPSSNVVIDHCSATWATDENTSTWYDNVTNFTFSNNLIAEALMSHSMGMLLGAGFDRASLVGNVFAHNNGRNPRVQKGRTHDAHLVMVNNLIYNHYWDCASINSVYGYDEPVHINSVNNLVYDGPQTKLNEAIYGFDSSAGYTLYHSGDKHHPYQSSSATGLIYTGSTVDIQSSPDFDMTEYVIMDTSSVENALLSSAGSRPADRDPQDQRILDSIQNMNGAWISSPSEVGGYTVLAENYQAFNAPANPNGDDDGDGYTNIEEVLHQMAAQVE